MKVKVEKRFGEWSVSISQGNQGFYLGHYEGASRAEVLWLAKMFRHAIRMHDEGEK